MASAQFTAFTTTIQKRMGHKVKTAKNNNHPRATPRSRPAQNKRQQLEHTSSMSNNSSSTSEGLMPPMVKHKLKTMAQYPKLSIKNPQTQVLPSFKNPQTVIPSSFKNSLNQPLPSIKNPQNQTLSSIKSSTLSKENESTRIKSTLNPEPPKPKAIIQDVQEGDSETSDEEHLLYNKSPTGHALEMDNTTFWNSSSTISDNTITDVSDMSTNAKHQMLSSSEGSSLIQEHEAKEEHVKSTLSLSEPNVVMPVKTIHFEDSDILVNRDTQYMPLEVNSEQTDLEMWLTYGAVVKLNSEQERLQYAADVFDSLYDSHFQNITCDVKVKVGEHVFQTNRFLLNYHSNKLGDVLATGELVKTSQVSLVEVPQCIFQTIYNWMYGRSVDLSGNDISQVFYFGQELGFQELVNEIKQLQTEMLSAARAPEMYAFAKVHSISTLEALSMYLMTHHFEEMLAHESFLKLPPTTFIYLLKQDDLGIGAESTALKAALRWLSYEDSGFGDDQSPNSEATRSRHQYSDSIFLLIRLESMPLQEFVELPKIVKLWLESQDHLVAESSVVRPLSIEHIAKRWNKRLFVAQRYQLAKLLGWCATSTLNLVSAGHLMRPRQRMPKVPGRSSNPAAADKRSITRSLNLKMEAPLLPLNRVTSLPIQGRQDFWYEIVPDVSMPNNQTYQTFQLLVENLPVTVRLQHLEQLLSHAIQQLWNAPGQRRKRCLKVIQHLGTKEILQSTADVILVAEDVEFKTHRCLLLHHFPDLGEKLYGSKVGVQPRVTLHGVKAHMVDFFYKWMYAADLDLDEEAGLTFSKVGYYAKQFGFQPLLKLWSRFTSDLLDQFFILEVVDQWDIKDEKQESLKKFACMMIMKRFGRMVADPRYLQLPYPTVCWLLSRDDVYIKSELDIFEAAGKWLYYHWASRQHVASHVMNCVRYNLLDTKELLEMVTAKDSILTVLNPEKRDGQWERLNLAMQLNMSQLINSAGEEFVTRDSPRTNMGKMATENQKHSNSTLEHGEILQVEETVKDLLSYEIIVLGCRAASRQASVDSEYLMMWRLNKLTERWEEDSMAMPEAFKDLAAVVLGKSIYVIGGVPCMSTKDSGVRALKPSARVLRYDLHEKQWTSITPMNVERAYHCGVALNGYLYVIGGMDGEGHFLGNMERYDPASAQWNFMESLHRPRAATTAAVHRGRLWVVGGLEKHGYYKIVSNAVESYDPKQDSWQMMQVLDVPRLFAVLLEYESRLYLVGGATNDAHYQKGKDLQVVRSIVVYNDERNEWVYETTMRSSRLRFAAGIYSDGTDAYLLVVGGRDQNSQAYLSTVECYYLKSKRWHSGNLVPSIPFALQSHCCLQVPSVRTS